MTSIVAPNRLLWADPNRNPLSTDGVNGDSWINWQTTDLFQKTNNQWQARFKMRGGGGPTGKAGNNGISLLHGVVAPTDLIGRVGEWYIWTTAPGGPRLYGPKGPGTWPTSYAGLAQIVFKAGAPAGGDGVDGQFLLDTASGVFYGPKAAGAWPSAPSAIFTTILTGAGAPSNGLGTNGQAYFDTAAGALYQAKTGGVWPSSPALLKAVLIGTGAPAGGLGADGQLYIDTASSVIYGPKASGSWPAGVSLVGPLPFGTPTPWVTATAYTATAPASAVLFAGSSYVCEVSHAAGVFATDLAAGKWRLLAAKGADGTGVGNVNTTGAVVGGRLAAYADTSGNLIQDSGLVTTDVDEAVTAAALFNAINFV